MIIMKITWLRRSAPLFSTIILILCLGAAGLKHPRPSYALPTGETGFLTESRQPAAGNRLIQDLQHAIHRVRPLLDNYGYSALFLAVLVEGLGLVAPGQTLLIAAALTAAQGGLNIAWVLFLAFTAAVLGNSLGYLLGRRGGRPLLHKFRLNEKHLQRLEAYFARYGAGLVLVARFFDGLRQLNGIVAGLLQMPWGKFTACNLLGAALWTGLWGLGTYFVDKEIASVHFTFRLIEPWIAALSLLSVLAITMYLLWPGRQTNS